MAYSPNIKHPFRGGLRYHHAMADDWNLQAERTLRAELARAGVNFTELSRRFAAMGDPQSPKSIAAKVQRGAFTFAFFLQCMQAIDQKVVRLRE